MNEAVTPSDTHDETGKTKVFDRYNALFTDVPGWFDPNAIATWDALLQFQETKGIKGNFLEFGVFQGKSAGMAALHAQPGESCVYLDMTPTTEARERIRAAAPDLQATFLQMMSIGFRSTPQFKALKNSVRWFHIDGGHSGKDVTNDLAIADKVLHPMGVAVLDDFFSPAYPQIVEALFNYLSDHRRHFTLFLTGHNKGYLCRPAAAQTYLQFVRNALHDEMTLRGCGNVTLWKTTVEGEVNAFGSCPQSEPGVAYRGLDTDQSKFVL